MVVRKGSCQGIANEVPPMDERCEVILPRFLKRTAPLRARELP